MSILISFSKIVKIFPFNLKIILIYFLSLLYPICYANAQIKDKLKIIFRDKPTINLEIADTKEKRKLGLMYRKHLNLNEGIIFDYKGFYDVKIWMKNTQIPLDIIFLQNDEIVHIKEKALPCLSHKINCPTFGSEKPVNFIIEVNAGIIKDYDLKIGDKLIFERKLN